MTLLLAIFIKKITKILFYQVKKRKKDQTCGVK